MEHCDGQLPRPQAQPGRPRELEIAALAAGAPYSRTFPQSCKINNRTLLAALERRDPSDALLDAVIAWENLVGADEGETTLRITTSLAWLLTSRATDRDAMQKKLRDLYRLRSRIVHGSTKITPRDAAERYQEALSITFAALRVLFQKRPDLLQETTSSARSRRLMLKT